MFSGKDTFTYLLLNLLTFDLMLVSNVANLENVVSIHCTVSLECVIIERTSFFDTDFALQINVAKLLLIHCLNLHVIVKLIY